VKVDRRLLKRAARLRVAALGPALGRRAGERRSRHVGRGVEFADFRDYQPGDDLRRVDWKVWSRLRKTVVKLFHEDRDLGLRVVLDASASMGFHGKDDHAANLAAVLAFAGLSAGDTVRLAVVGEGSPGLEPSGKDPRALGGMLRLLETSTCRGRADLARVLGRSQGLDRVMLVTDMLVGERERETILRALAASSRAPTLVHVLAPPETDPMLDQPARLVDAETGRELLIRGGGRAREDYGRALELWLASLAERCARLGIRYLPAFTEVSLETLLSDRLVRGRALESATGAS